MPAILISSILLIALGVGLLCGLWNGFLVAILDIQPIIATLILMVSGRGIGLMINLLYGGTNPSFTSPLLQGLSVGHIGLIPTRLIRRRRDLLRALAADPPHGARPVPRVGRRQLGGGRPRGDQRAPDQICGLSHLRALRGLGGRHPRRRHPHLRPGQHRTLHRTRRDPRRRDRRRLAVRAAASISA